jgi:hypothetical protein
VAHEEFVTIQMPYFIARKATKQLSSPQLLPRNKGTYPSNTLGGVLLPGISPIE